MKKTAPTAIGTAKSGSSNPLTVEVIFSIIQTLLIYENL